MTECKEQTKGRYHTCSRNVNKTWANPRTARSWKTKHVMYKHAIHRPIKWTTIFRFQSRLQLKTKQRLWTCRHSLQRTKVDDIWLCVRHICLYDLRKYIGPIFHPNPYRDNLSWFTILYRHNSQLSHIIASSCGSSLPIFMRKCSNIPLFFIHWWKRPEV
jgi:hypothetical protein